MPEQLTTTWGDLASHGYVIVPGFLDGAEVSALAADFHQRPDWGGPYAGRFSSPSIVELLAPKISAVTAHARAVGVDADAGHVGMYFPIDPSRSAGEFQTTQWHVDSLGYYLYQQMFHHLNFWIPIVKPDRARTGMSIVPMTSLRESEPEVYDAALGRGASDITDHQTFQCEDKGALREVPLRGDLEQLAVSPELGPGDLFLVRGDVLHRTQDIATERVAWSIRTFSSLSPIRKDILLEASSRKRLRMRTQPAPFQALLSVFWQCGKDEITWRDVEAAMKREGCTQLPQLVDAMRSRGCPDHALALPDSPT